MPTLPSQEPDVQVVGLQRAAGSGGECLLTVQNLGPCRRRLRLGRHGQVVGQRDGLHQPVTPLNDGKGQASGGGGQESEPVLAPWSLTFWQVRLVCGVQSS
jgi:hypothetical protein